MAKKTSPAKAKSTKKNTKKSGKTTLETVLATQNQALLDILEQKRGSQGPNITLSGMSVGVRNISSVTIGINDSPTPNEGEIQLTADTGGFAGGVAVISYPWYRQMRGGRHFQNGLLVRDDSILGPMDVAAPADGPGDVHSDHAKNRVDKPHEWIESRTEVSVRRDVQAMTSESSLRRLAAAVDEKVEEFRKKFGCDGHDTAKEEEAALAIPSIYTLTEKLVENRLQALNPIRLN
jgi:hypothetical protein